MDKTISGPGAEAGGFYVRAQGGHPAANHDTPHAEELTLGDVFRFAISALPFMVAGAVVFGLIALMMLTFQRAGLPSMSAYRTALLVTMNSNQPGKYPNGSDFAYTDLRSPVVLDEVFRTNKLSDYNISLAGFSDMVTVEPYSPSYDSLAERFRARLENKTLTFEERKGIEDEFRREIEADRARGILVTFSASESTKLPEVLAQKIVNDIPAKWASVFINQLGVTNLPVPVSGEDIVDTKLVAELDYPLAYDYLVNQSLLVKSQLEAIRALPGSISFVAKANGKGVVDLQRELESIDQFRLKLGLKPIVDQGLTREPAVTSLIYLNLINSLEKDASEQAALSQRTSSVINEFRSNKDAGQGGITTSASGAQFDGAFVDKIVELSKQGAGLEFEQDLLRKKLEYEIANVNFSDRKGRLVERLNSINQGTLVGDVRANIEKKFLAGIARSTDDLNRLWADSVQFMNDLNEKRLNFDKSLYKLTDLPEKMRVEKPSLVTTYTLIVAAAALLAGLVAGLFAYGWRQAAGSRYLD